MRTPLTTMAPFRPPCLIAALVLGTVVDAAAAMPSLDLDAGAFHDDNLTRAQAPADRRADRGVALGARAWWHLVSSSYETWTLGVEARGEAYRRYPGLGFASVGASAHYRRKLALGLRAPYVAVSAGAAYADYREDVRDGTTLRLDVALGKRFDEALAASVAVGYDRRHARTDIPIVPGVSGAIFDLRGASLRGDVEYGFDERWQVSARIGVRRGDVESTSQRNRAVFLASSAIADDPAFGDPALFGYRLRGTTVSASAALSYALHERAAVNVGYLQERTRAAEGLEYVSRVVDASIAWRF